MIKRYPIPEPKRIQKEGGAFVAPSKTCIHDWRLTRYDCEGGAVQYRRQCAKCGITNGGAIRHAELTQEQKDGARAYDQGLYAQVNDAAWRAWKDAAEADGNGHDALWWTWYKGYLASNIWAERRELVMARCGEICEACGEEPATRVHHLSYAHVGYEPLFELAGVCNPCHEIIHGGNGHE